MENRKRTYYIAQGHRLVRVSESVYKELSQTVNSSRYQAIWRGECLATRKEASLCEADCNTCRYHHAGLTASVEELEARCDTQIVDRRANNTEMQYRVIELTADAARVDPEYGESICYLLSLGYEAKDIAKALGMSLNAYRARFNRLQRRLR